MANASRPAVTDRLAPKRNARWPIARQRLPPDAETVDGRVDEEVARPHPSQTRMCRFPASGSSWESLARGGVAMDNSRRWQRAALEECSEPAPVEPAPAIPPRQPFLPNPRDLVGVPA